MAQSPVVLEYKAAGAAFSEPPAIWDKKACTELANALKNEGLTELNFNSISLLHESTRGYLNALSTNAEGTTPVHIPSAVTALAAFSNSLMDWQNNSSPPSTAPSTETAVKSRGTTAPQTNKVTGLLDEVATVLVRSADSIRYDTSNNPHLGDPATSKAVEAEALKAALKIYQHNGADTCSLAQQAKARLDVLEPKTLANALEKAVRPVAQRFAALLRPKQGA